nr:metallophosphoesterase [Bacteroidota bacterium]
MLSKRSLTPLFLCLFILVSSCERIFEYTPYSADVKDKRKYTREQNFEKLRKIEDETAGQKTFKIALISDSHTSYNSLAESINHINLDEGVLFVIHGGDMTDGGMIAEYTIFYQIMEKLKRPSFTVIGNHDCLANGRVIYNEQYGPENYAFIFKNCKFIFFNNVVWELNYEEPDWNWLIKELEDSHSYDKTFVIAHIPPWSDQFSPLDTWAYKAILDTSNVTMSIHGHHHDHYYGHFFDDSVPYLVIGSPDKDIFCKLTVEPDTVIIETIIF